MTPLLVGLDIGTTNVKAVVYEPDGAAVAAATTGTPTHYPEPGRAFYRADELWERAVQVLREALAAVEDPRRVTGIAVASMGEAGVLLDAAGEPTGDVIAWFDTRGEPQAAWLDQTIGKDALFARSGVSLQPIFSLAKLLWLKQHEPDAWRRSVRWLHVADYVAFRLSGVAATDLSLASRTLAFNLHERQWDTATIDAAGIDPGLFAPLVEGGAPLGPVTPEAAATTALPTTAIVAAGGHDHVCGAFAAGVTAPGTMLNSLGTAEAVFLPLAAPLTDPAAGRQGYTQGAHVVNGATYVFAGQYTSGASVDWLRDLLGIADDPAVFAAALTAAAAVPPGSLGTVFLPHLRLANPPYDDPRSRGALLGLSTDVKPATLLRAVLEGLAFESRNTFEPLLAYPGVELPRSIVAIGGGTRNRLLMEIKATVMNQTHTIIDVDEATALGAALLAGLGAGVYPDVATAVAALKLNRITIEPVAANVARYEQIFRDIYQQLYPTVAPLSHALQNV